MSVKYGMGDMHKSRVRNMSIIDRKLEYFNMSRSDKTRLTKSRKGKNTSNYECEVCGVFRLTNDETMIYWHKYKKHNIPFRLVCRRCFNDGFVPRLPSFNMKPKISEKQRNKMMLVLEEVIDASEKRRENNKKMKSSFVKEKKEKVVRRFKKGGRFDEYTKDYYLEKEKENNLRKEFYEVDN